MYLPFITAKLNVNVFMKCKCSFKTIVLITIVHLLTLNIIFFLDLFKIMQLFINILNGCYNVELLKVIFLAVTSRLLDTEKNTFKDITKFVFIAHYGTRTNVILKPSSVSYCLIVD